MFKIFRSALFLALIQMLAIAPNLNAASMGFSAPVDFSCNLPAPANLQANSITPNGFTLTWNSVSGASGYYITITNTLTGAVVYSGAVAGTNLPVSGLSSATSYTVTAASICGNGQVSAITTGIVVITDYIVVDDIVADFPTTGPVIGCNNDVAIPACLVVRYKQTEIVERFEIEFNDARTAYRVTHGNLPPNSNGQYTAGWYFGNYYHEVPANGASVYSKGEVNVFHFVGNGLFSVSDADPQLKFQLLATADPSIVRICYESRNYAILKSTCELQRSGGNNGSSTLKSAETLTAAPVPFTDQLQLSLSPALTETESEVQLMDANGRLVRRVFAGAGTSQLNIEANELSPGIYWVRHLAAGAVQTLKVIKAE